MAERWTTKLKEKAEELWAEDVVFSIAALELDLSEDMVKTYFAELDGEGEEPEVPAPPKKRPAKKKAKKKKAKKKTAKKKGPKKSAKTIRKAPAAKEEPTTKKARIAALIAATNERLGEGVVRLAEEQESDYLLRRPTGILSLDIALGGGWPASSLCLLTGPDGAGKDQLLNLTLAQQQQIYGDDFACLIYSTEFKFDKMFARDFAGFKVGMSKKELDRHDLALEAQGLPLLDEEQRARYGEKIGHTVLIDGVIADDALDVVLDAVYSNEFQVCAINSLGVLQTAAKEEKENLREHAIQSNEAQLLTRFMPHLFMLLNRQDSRGDRNQTLVLATNQVRAKRDMGKGKPGFRIPERAKYQGGSGSRALAHGKAIELAIHKGSPHLDKEAKPPVLLGREIDWEITKGKLGTHDGIRGSFDFWFDNGVDTLTDLINTGVTYGVIEKGGAWYSYQHDGEEIKGQGVANFRFELAEFPEAMEAIRGECLREAEVVCLYK